MVVGGASVKLWIVSVSGEEVKEGISEEGGFGGRDFTCW